MIVLLNGSLATSLLNFRRPLLKELLARGHAVHASAPQMDEQTWAGLSDLGIVVHDVPLQRTGTGLVADLAYFRALRRLMRGIGADYVVNYTIKPNIWGSLAARSLGVKSASMVTGLGYAFAADGGFKQRLLGYFAKRLYRAATRANEKVIFQNPDDIRDFAASGALVDPNKAVRVNGSGVDVSRFAAAPLPSEPRFLMIARMLGAKGVREYAAAAKSLRDEGVDWPFTLVGPFDPQPDGIGEHEVDGWVGAGEVDYRGSANDVLPYLQDCSVYVLPSYREGTPRSVLEAMACGRAIITTDTPGCRETVEDGWNGILVPPRDADALALAMKMLGNDAKARENMGERSRERAVKQFDDAAVARAVCNALGL